MLKRVTIKIHHLRTCWLSKTTAPKFAHYSSTPSWNATGAIFKGKEDKSQSGIQGESWRGRGHMKDYTPKPKVLFAYTTLWWNRCSFLEKNKFKQQGSLQIFHLVIIENMSRAENKIILLLISEFIFTSLHSPYIHHNTGKSSLRADVEYSKY